MNLTNTSWLSVLVLCSMSLFACRQRTNPESTAANDLAVSSEIEGSANRSISGATDRCESNERIRAVTALSSAPVSEQAKFAAATHEFGDSSEGSSAEQIWVMLLPRKPEGSESIFQVRPSINITFSGWPEAGKKYAVSDDCYEPKRTENPVAVCGQLQVTGGEVSYSKVPGKNGGTIAMEFNFTDSQGQVYAGVAESCLSTSSSVAILQ